MRSGPLRLLHPILSSNLLCYLDGKSIELRTLKTEY